MEIKYENRLLLYALFSAVSFVYLVMPAFAGVSVPVFMLFQLVCFWFILPDRKKICFLFPAFIFSLNSFMSANRMWSAVNFLLSPVFYSLMLIEFNIKDTSSKFLADIIVKLFEPFKYLNIPFVLVFKANKEKAALIKRVMIALIITGPSVILLTVILASADMVFAKGAGDFFAAVFKTIKFETLFKILFGTALGFYLFGLLYSAKFKREAGTAGEAPKGDLVVLSILLISILAIYTVFVIIQFKYLFAGAKLPGGLTYTEYARKGFFEQFALTGVNIILILLTVHLTKNAKERWGAVSKALCCYLCAVTIILLVSSFYRMRLYYLDDGLTRMRFLVFGFLIFELFGLLITFFYILKPKFNMVAVYLALGIIYYLLLNIVPMDYYVAKSQVERALRGNTNGIAYTLTLSADAALQIERLANIESLDENKRIRIEESIDYETQLSVKDYIQYKYKRYITRDLDWRGYNISESKMAEIYGKYS